MVLHAPPQTATHITGCPQIVNRSPRVGSSGTSTRVLRPFRMPMHNTKATVYRRNSPALLNPRRGARASPANERPAIERTWIGGIPPDARKRASGGMPPIREYPFFSAQVKKRYSACCTATARAISIIWVKLFWRSSAGRLPSRSIKSDTVMMPSAFLCAFIALR